MTGKAKTTSKTKRRANSKKSIDATLKKLKTKVRQKIVKGEPLTGRGSRRAMEAREIQMKIAQIEERAAAASERRGKAGSAAASEGSIEVKLQKQIETLRKGLRS